MMLVLGSGIAFSLGYYPFSMLQFVRGISIPAPYWGWSSPFATLTKTAAGMCLL